MRYERSGESFRRLREVREGRGFDTGSFLVDRDGAIVGFDSGMERLTGWTAAEVVRRASSSPVLAQGPLPPGRRDSVDLTLKTKDGALLEVEASVARPDPVSDHAIVSVLRVIARAEDEIEPPPAGRDTLTGLESRATFTGRLETELRAASGTGRPVAVVLADVDRLRAVADLHGPTAATRVLVKLGGILRAGVRDEDVVARFEDDDFGILFPGLGRGTARQIAARLRSTVERFRFKSKHADDEGVGITLSLGAASYPADADNVHDLLARAKEALDEARALGRNRVWCYTRRPRVPLRTPVFLDGTSPHLLGYSQDLSPSGLFVATSSVIDVGMRCALSFPLPTAQGKVHVIGRVVRTVAAGDPRAEETRGPGVGVEFEKFGPEDRRAIDAFLFHSEAAALPGPRARAFSV
ncbi:MAG TPA: diguanylate cyclase [Candidatus Sulfotelmatobacter sp.]|jgi:diguanylate cyclase (GGDEF)-like protein|nr:diguanylate cyclase [Candidatus Sulfotelmatobacter sp.]